MPLLINILILFFIILIGYQIILANHVIEGLDNANNTTTANTTNSSNASYNPYDTNNPNNALILAQQNAGNIDYLKQRFDSIQGVFQQVQDLSGNVATLQDQVNGLVSAQQQYATQMTGGTAPEITGATTSDDTATTSDGTTDETS
jgi:uncharacterized protein YoxC